MASGPGGDSAWPYESFSTSDFAWAQEAVGAPNVGLRAGLVIALGMLEADGQLELAAQSDQDRLITAIFYLREMLERGKDELSWLMAEALYKGASWGDIARALEVSRQAAHKRFAPQVHRRIDAIPQHQDWLRRMREWETELEDQARPESAH